MPDARLDPELGAEEAGQCLGFCRRLDDNQGFCHKAVPTYHCCRRRPEGPARQPDDAAGDFMAAQTGEQHRGRQAGCRLQPAERQRLSALERSQDRIACFRRSGGQICRRVARARWTGRAPREAEGGEDVVGGLDERGPVADERVAALVAEPERRPGHRHHLAALVGGAAGRDQRTALERGLDHHDAQRHAADDPVPAREVLRLRLGGRGSSETIAPLAAITLARGPCSGRIDAVEPAEHADGRARVERALVGGFVDAAGQAAGNHEAEAGKVAGQRRGHVERRRRGVTRPDDGDHRPCERGRVAVDPEERRRIGDRRQPRRIGLPAEDQRAAAAGGEIVEQARRPPRPAPASAGSGADTPRRARRRGGTWTGAGRAIAPGRHGAGWRPGRRAGRKERRRRRGRARGLLDASGEAGCSC